jgi:hypothetical protein
MSSEVPESLRAANAALQRVGASPESEAWNVLRRVGKKGKAKRLVTLKSAAGLEGDKVERLFLWYAAKQAALQIPTLPLEGQVRRQLAQDLEQLHAVNASVVTGSYEFTRAAKIATLRRFSAGPMEWEIDRIPRLSPFKAAFPENFRLLAFITLHVGGWAPCFFMHVAPAPRNRALTVPKQVQRAYYRMARCLQLQPAVRALVAHSWFHDPTAVRDYPHLRVLSEPYIDHGGLIVRLDPASRFSGVLEGNYQRKADFESGKVGYRYGLAIWPRVAAIRWADAHTELSDPDNDSRPQAT